MIIEMVDSLYNQNDYDYHIIFLYETTLIQFNFYFPFIAKMLTFSINADQIHLFLLHFIFI